MIFFLFIVLSFFVGILACIPLAPYFSPPPAHLLIILFLPWTLLYIFSQNPLISDVRNLYLSFIFGMCSYWIYFETIKKMHKP